MITLFGFLGHGVLQRHALLPLAFMSTSLRFAVRQGFVTSLPGLVSSTGSQSMYNILRVEPIEVLRSKSIQSDVVLSKLMCEIR